MYMLPLLGQLDSATGSRAGLPCYASLRCGVIGPACHEMTVRSPRPLVFG